MALIDCPECGYETLSENAYVCPCCGCYVNDLLDSNQAFKKSKKDYKILYIISFLFPPVGLLAFVILFTKEDWYRKCVGDYCLFLSIISSVLTIVILVLIFGTTIAAIYSHYSQFIR